MEHIRLDPCIDSDPDIEAAGFWGARVFELLLKVSAWKDLHGRVPPQYLRPDWLAKRWNLAQKDIPGLEVEGIILDGTERLIRAGLLTMESDATLVIRGWDKFYKRPQTNAERQEAWRERQRSKGVTDVTQVTATVTNNATPLHTTPLHTTKTTATASPAAARGHLQIPDAPIAPDAKPEPDPEPLRELWNATAHPSLPRCLRMTEKRKPKAKARLAERPLPEWVPVIERINASAFCRGERGDRGWKADFDWLLKPDTATKVLEGKYDDPPEKSDLARDLAPARVAESGQCEGCGRADGYIGVTWGARLCPQCSLAWGRWDPKVERSQKAGWLADFKREAVSTAP